MKRIHQESLDQTAAEVRWGKPACQRVMKAQKPVPVYPVYWYKQRPRTRVRKEAVRRGNDKNIAYNVKAGTTMRKVKNFKIFDAHRGMPNK
jgi:hypothetical protein